MASSSTCAPRWAGLPLTVELHSQPNWVDGVRPCDGRADRECRSQPARGRRRRRAAARAARARARRARGSHRPLGRLGNLIDVAVTLAAGVEVDAGAPVGMRRMWRTTRARDRRRARGGGTLGRGRAVGAAPAERREPTSSSGTSRALWRPSGDYPVRVPAAVVSQARATAGPEAGEPWRSKLRRARLALRNAGTARSEHILALDEALLTTEGTEAG